MSVSLNGLHVLVTRPAPAGNTLCDEINAAGGQAIFFPTISFAPAADAAAFEQRIEDLEQYDWVIFISPQAVYSSSGQIQIRWPQWPAKVKIAAVGAGTAAALDGANFKVSAMPKEEWSSDGLLDLPEFNNVAGKKIAIICGAEGRDNLVAALTARGATVIACIAYRRCLPNVKVNDTVIKIQTQQVDAIVCASGTGIENLKKLLMLAWPQLRKVPLVVISERLVEVAKQAGFKKVFLARNASHAAILTTLANEFVHHTPPKNRLIAKAAPAADIVADTNHETSGSLFKTTSVLFTLIALALLAVGLYTAYCQLIKGGSRLANVTANLTNKFDQDQSAIAALQKSVQDAQQTDQQLQTIVAAQQQLLTEMHASQQNADLWRVSEAQYLASLANDNLQLGDNVALVVTLLQNADQKLRDITDPKVVAVRKALATDIAALQAVPNVDITGIYLQLTALNAQVDKLVMPVSRPEAAQTQPVDADKRVVWWRRGLQQTWEALSKVIVVRYNQGGERPFIPPDQQAFLFQNLHAMFEQALTAVVHRQTTIYRTSLEQAQMWIKKYYLPDSPLTISVLNNLNQLQNQTLRPALPDMNATMQAFHDYFAANNTQGTDATVTQ